MERLIIIVDVIALPFIGIRVPKSPHKSAKIPTVWGRILINGSFAPSVVNFRGPLIRSLQDRGYEVHVSVPAPSQEDRISIEALGVVIHVLPLERTGTRIFADARYFLAMWRLISRLRPQMVLSYTIKPNIWGSLAAKMHGARSASMVTGLGYAFLNADSLTHRLVSTISRVLYKRAIAANDVVIFQNTDDLRDFRNAGCIEDVEKARLVNGSGVDTDHFHPVPLPEKAVFLLVARLLKAKGIREYAEAAIRLLSEGLDADFLLVGPWDSAPDSISREELDEWQTNGLEYREFARDVRVPMRNASVFVLPSYREGTPRTVLEAAAMGRPVITTDVPGCRETVVDGKTGILVEVGNVDSLASAMRKIAGNKEMRRRMGSAAREFCVDKYKVDKVNQTLIEHLRL